MRRNATGHKIERSVAVGKLFGGVLAGRDLEAAFGSSFRRAVEHGLGEVGQRHVVAKAGEVKSGMAAACGDIENPGAGRKRHFFGGSTNVIDVLQNMAL